VSPEDLVEIEAIKRLKYRYLRCLDEKLWDELRDCFSEDATSAYSDGQLSFDGRDAILEFLRSAMGAASFHSSHFVHHPEIDLVGPAAATGVWALEDTIIEASAGITIRGAGFYSDEYRKSDGVWRIGHTGYRRTWEEMQTRKHVPGLRLTASAWGAAESDRDA
jgi:hypothetical protein